MGETENKVEELVATEATEATETKKKNWFISLFSDRDWDCDLTKVLGLAIIVAGLVGFFLEKLDFHWVIAFGSGLVATGKFSKEG